MSRGHILILVQNLPVPFDRRVWMEAQSLRTAGYDVSVVSPAPPGEEPHQVIDGVRVRRYPQPPPSSGVTSYFREYVHSYRWTSRLTKALWEEERFDVIQTCNPPDLFWAIARRYRRHGVRFVFDHHDLVPELYLSKFGRKDVLYHALRFLEARQFATADAVISTNESYRRVAMGRGRMPQDRVTVVRSGPPADRFRRSDAVPALKRGREHLVVYLGVMNSQDGVDYALRAIRHAVDEGLDSASFTFIGEGDASDAMVVLRDELGLGDVVHFTGRIPNDDLIAHLSTADLALAPDPCNPLNDVSTMNKIIEYMAMGLPIVSFDLKESRASAQEAAVYVSDDDTAAMGDALIRLLGDPDRRALMGAFGRRRFEQHLAWAYSEAELLGFYEALLGGRGNRGGPAGAAAAEGIDTLRFPA